MRVLRTRAERFGAIVATENAASTDGFSVPSMKPVRSRLSR